jgi:thiamine-monophosphate kinase
MIRRGGAQAGDVVLITGSIGDGVLGLSAAREEALGLSAADTAWLKARYQLPQPRLGLGEALRRWGRAAADISDGLVADAGHIAAASRLALSLDLDRMPISPAGQAWLGRQPDPVAARLALATGGDDYEVLCTAPPSAAASLKGAAEALGFALTEIGSVSPGEGVQVLSGGQELRVARTGWRHG